MSKLDELINELCPNGVEYKTIDDIAVDIYRGSGIKRDEVTESGIPCVRYGEIYTTYGAWFEKCKSHTQLEYVKSPKYFEHGDILFAITGESVEDIAKCCAYIGNEKCLAGGDIVVLKHNEDPKYISYALSTVEAKKQKSAGKVKSKVVHSSVPSIKAIRLPVPPLEVQREIVHILDSFTLLTAELTAELTARRKQYEFYRDKLLTIKDDIPIKKIGEICKVVSGGTPSRKNAEYWGNGSIKWLGSTVCQNKKTIDKVTDYITNEGLVNSSAKIMREGTTLVALVGATIGKVAFLPYDAAINQNIAGIFPKDRNILNPSYLYYACTMLYPKFLKLTKGSKLAMANLSFIRELEIPVPHIEVQNRIVYVLEHFEDICSDLNIGLPAEIEARQKQYEYYRDVLLTFAETGKTILTDRQTDRQTEHN